MIHNYSIQVALLASATAPSFASVIGLTRAPQQLSVHTVGGLMKTFGAHAKFNQQGKETCQCSYNFSPKASVQIKLRKHSYSFRKLPVTTGKSTSPFHSGPAWLLS